MGLPFLNPSVIAQGVKPVQVPDPMEQMQAIERLRQARNQNALAPLHAQELQGQIADREAQVQQRTLANQNTVEDTNDQAAIHKELQNPDNLDESGKPVFEKVRAAVAPKVKLRNLQAFDADNLKLQQGSVALASSKIKSDQEKWQHVKNLNQMTGEHLAGIIQAPTEAKQDMYADAMADLKEAGVDTSKYPTSVPNDDILKAEAAKVGYLGTIITNADKLAQEDQRKETAAKIKAAAATKATDDMHKEFATAAQGVSNKDGWDKAIKDFAAEDDVHAAFAKRWLNPLPFSATAVKTANNRAIAADKRAELSMTQEQRDEQKRHDQAMENRPGRNGGLTANAEKVQSRYDRTEQTKDSAAHEAIQGKETDLWALRQKYGDAIAKAQQSGADTIKDPKTGRDVSIQDAQVSADLARDKAVGYQNQAKGLRAKHGWGEFSQQQDDGGDDQSALPPKQKPASTVAQPVAAPSIPIEGTGMGAQPSAAPVSQTPSPSVNGAQSLAIDPSIKQMGGYEVGKEYETKTGRKIKIKGFTKDGKAIPE